MRDTLKHYWFRVLMWVDSLLSWKEEPCELNYAPAVSEQEPEQLGI